MEPGISGQPIERTRAHFPAEFVKDRLKYLWYDTRNALAGTKLVFVAVYRVKVLTLSDIYAIIPREYLQDQTVYYIKNVKDDPVLRNLAVLTNTFVEGGLELWLEREKASAPAPPSVNNRAWGIENKVTWSGFGLNVVPAGQSQDSVSGKTMQECAAICNSDSNRCAGFTWRANEQNANIGSCWFKSDVSSKAIPSSRTFYTLTNPNFRNPAPDVQSAAQNAGQAAGAAASISQALAGMSNALASTNIVYATNQERGVFVQKVLGSKKTENFTVRNLTPNKTSTGTWKGSQVLTYLSSFPPYPASMANLVIDRGKAFVTKWDASGSQVNGFTVQWKSGDHGYLYEVSVSAAQIPASLQPAPASAPATAPPAPPPPAPSTAPPAPPPPPPTPPTSSAPVIPPAASPAAPAANLAPYPMIASLWSPAQLHLALAEEIKRAQANQWNESMIVGLNSPVGMLNAGNRRKFVVNTLLYLLTNGYAIKDIDVMAIQRGYITPSLLSVLFGWGDLVQAWKVGDVPAAVTLESDLSKRWLDALRGPMQDGVDQISTIQTAYNYRAPEVASKPKNTARINTFLADTSQDYALRTSIRVMALALDYAVIPLPPQPSTTTASSPSTGGTTAATEPELTMSEAGGAVASLWNQGDVDGALKRFYYYAFEARTAFGQADLANEVIKFAPMTKWAKAVKTKPSTLDKKYIAAAFNSSAAIPELKKAFWSRPVDLLSAMTLLDVVMNQAGTLSSGEANNAVDLAFRRDQVTLFLSKPGNSAMHADMRKMALDTQTFTTDVLTEWMNSDRDNVSYNGQIRTSKPSQMWGVSNNVTWTGFGLNVVPAGSSSDSLTSISLSACAEACAKDNAKCAGFTWRPTDRSDPLKGNCWFKSDAANEQPLLQNPVTGEPHSDPFLTPEQEAQKKLDAAINAGGMPAYAMIPKANLASKDGKPFMDEVKFPCLDFQTMKTSFMADWDKKDYNFASARLAAIKECHKNSEEVKKLISDTGGDKEKIANKLLGMSKLESEATAKRLFDLGLLPSINFKEYATEDPEEEDKTSMIAGISLIAALFVILLFAAFR
eukprot:jgi/Mesvir1/23319/Mv21015-RA.1